MLHPLVRGPKTEIKETPAGISSECIAKAVRKGQPAVILQVVKAGKTMLGTCTVQGDVAMTSRTVSQELLDPRAFRQGGENGCSRPGGSGTKRKARELAN